MLNRALVEQLEELQGYILGGKTFDAPGKPCPLCLKEMWFVVDPRLDAILTTLRAALDYAEAAKIAHQSVGWSDSAAIGKAVDDYDRTRDALLASIEAEKEEAR